MVVAENRPGDPTFALFSGSTAGRSPISTARGSAPRPPDAEAPSPSASRATRSRSDDLGGRPDELHVRRADAVRPSAEAGRHGARSQILSSTLRRVRRRPVRGPRRDELLGAARRRRGRPAPPAAPDLDAAAGEVGADVHRRAVVRRLRPGRRRPRSSSRAPGSSTRASADRPLIFTDPPSLSFGYLAFCGRREPRDPGDGLGRWWRRGHVDGGDPPQVASTGATVEAAPVTVRRVARRSCRSSRAAAAGAVQGDNFGFVVLPARQRRRGASRTRSRSRARRSPAPGDAACGRLQSGDTRRGDDRARVYRWPTSPFSILGIFGVDPSVNDDGREKIYSLEIRGRR